MLYDSMDRICHGRCHGVYMKLLGNLYRLFRFLVYLVILRRLYTCLVIVVTELLELQIINHNRLLYLSPALAVKSRFLTCS